jgi:hypothetical protein
MSSALAKLGIRCGEKWRICAAHHRRADRAESAALPHLDFTGTTFTAPVTLRGAVFQGLRWFMTDCTFMCR